MKDLNLITKMLRNIPYSNYLSLALSQAARLMIEENILPVISSIKCSRKYFIISITFDRFWRGESVTAPGSYFTVTMTTIVLQTPCEVRTLENP